MLETIMSVFAFGEIGFFIVLAVLSIIYTYAVENDEHGLAIFGTIVGCILLWHPVKTVFIHWHLTLIVLCIYVAIGGIWSVFRWFKFCRKYVNEIDPWPDEGHSRFGTPITPQEYYADRLIPARHKSKITSWIIYWPWSGFWNLAGDVITGIFDVLTNVYKSIAASVVKRATATIKIDNSPKSSINN